MSRFGNDYPLAPGRSTGWRSVFKSALAVGMIVAVSAISGAVVSLDLLGSASQSDERAAVAATKAPLTPVLTARTVTPIFAQPVSLPAPAAAVAQPATPAATASAATSAQPAAPQAAPAPSVASAEEPATAQVPESQLTFTNGYARRRAMQAAATSGGAKIEVARAESESQIRRVAKAKPRTVARQQDQRHVADARGENGPFARFDAPNRSDSAHRLAYGDQRDPRANRRSQGGLFGGFFGGMF